MDEPPLELDYNTIYFCDPRKKGDVEVPPGLFIFLSHSDCDGEISPEDCTLVADALEELLPKIEAITGTPWSGHVSRDGGYSAVTRKFIAGCREAAAANEPLYFA